MSLLLALLPDAAARARLVRALQAQRLSRHHHEVVWVDDWPRLHTAAAAGLARLAVVDPHHPHPGGVAECAAFHARFPSVAILPYSDFDGPRKRMLMRLPELGATDVILAGEDDTPETIRRRVEAVLDAAIADAVLAAVGDVVPAQHARLVRRLLLEAGRPLTPVQAARLSFCHPKTLRAHLRAAGLPSLGRLIVWTRLFHAAHLLSDPGRSAASVALALDFPSVSAFRVQLRRYTGMSPSELRAGNGVARLASEFRARFDARAWDAAGAHSRAALAA